jgi:hypothetical protein
LERLVVEAPNNGLDFAGELSSSIVKLNKLSFFSLSNVKVRGSLPADLGEMSSLKEFLVNDSFLTGEIPVSLCKILSLERLALGRNEFSGISLY